MVIDNYDPMKEIKVSKDMVEECETYILNYLESQPYIHIGEKLCKLQNYQLEYNENNSYIVFENLTKEFSEFMAFQEALFRLMNKNKIMPVNNPNIIHFSSDEIRINYQEHRSGCITTGSRDLSVPILPYNTFMLIPSEKNEGK